MWARSATAPHRVVSQAKALLMAGDGVANSRVATALGISRPTVLDWRARFRRHQPADRVGLAGTVSYRGFGLGGCGAPRPRP